MKRRAVVLFSGGLDSMLAARLLRDQGFDVEGLTFLTPFSSYESARESAKRLGIRIHFLRVDREYFDMIRKPKHGYGANINPCIDCKIYMLRKAKIFAGKMGADFIATGEVLGERPFSQKRPLMKIIEEDSGLAGRIVRPLSGRLLPPTDAEKNGIVKRDNLLSIRGRSRKPQMKLARELGIDKYPAPGGGCLLTDPEFSKKLRDFLMNSRKITWEDVEFLKLGRHFRLGSGKIIVGRNHRENRQLFDLAEKRRLPWMEVKYYMGPLTVLQGRGPDLVSRAASLTVRYSDAPDREVDVSYVTGKRKKTIRAKPIGGSDLERMRVK